MSNGMCSPPTEDRDPGLMQEMERYRTALEYIAGLGAGCEDEMRGAAIVALLSTEGGITLELVDPECPDCEGRGCVECGGNPSQE